MNETAELLQHYLKIVNSAENRENKKYWSNADEPYLIERWRGISKRRENTPFTMAMDISGYSRVLGIDCSPYYTIPGNEEYQLNSQLRYAIWESENLKCHRYFENTVFLPLGSIFEASLFGAKVDHLPDQAPWIDERDHLIKERTDILKIKPLDFHANQACQKVIESYNAMRKITEGYDIRVMFPACARSAFSTAIMLRGFTNLLLDIYDDPDFFNDLMRLITDYYKEYAIKRAEFLCEPVNQSLNGNDDISTPTISNDIYEKFILPYEIEMSRFCNGAKYWHSCGVTDVFYESISSIPGLRMMHIGPWSNIEKAVGVFSKTDTALEICINSVADVYDRNEDEMRRKLLNIKETCDGRIKYSVRADGFAILNSIDESLEKIRLWNKVAMEVFPG